MITRARPLLGTLVAIRADVDQAAIERAFAAVERVHRLMSFHSSDSDVARINREAHQRVIPVDPRTFEVLRCAKQLSETTDSAFDIVLPGAGGCHADLILAEDPSVRLRRPMRIDLGGIAKGFAVDEAIASLVASGASRGCVNAGGDLRRFGSPFDAICVRVPGSYHSSIALPSTPHAAFATSSSYFGSRINDVREKRKIRLDWSVTVAAPTCMLADALTKAVALLGPVPSLLRAFGAAAFAVDREGRLYAAGT
ncbi:MAG TPA: FAD:protein FMN transferase [Burkholderiales bacterium]